MVHSYPWSGRKCYGSGSSWERPHDGGGLLRDTRSSSEPERLGQALRDQPQDRRKWRKRDTPKISELSPALNEAFARRGGGLPAPYAAAARRLPVRQATPLVPAPLPAAPRHLTPARGRRRQARQAHVQGPATSTSPSRGGPALSAGGDPSKFASVELHEKVTTRGAGDFLFTTPSNTASAAPLIKEALERGEPVSAHAPRSTRLTKPKHQRPSRTDEPDPEGGNRSYYETHHQLRQHLADGVERLQLQPPAEVPQGPHTLKNLFQ
jgi:hypothetical protein